MSGTKTLTIIKPDAVSREYTGRILDIITRAGFHIAAMKLISLTRKMAEDFYAVHKSKPFYPGLIQFITSGPVVVAILEKENAVEDYRKLIGTTDPAKANEGTIRKMYAESTQKNAVHGSDSDENAATECDFFFSMLERYPKFDW